MDQGAMFRNPSRKKAILEHLFYLKERVLQVSQECGRSLRSFSPLEELALKTKSDEYEHVFKKLTVELSELLKDEGIIHETGGKLVRDWLSES